MIIIIWLLVIAYNIFFNKKSKGGEFGGYTVDVKPLVRGLVSVIIGLILTIIIIFI